MSQLIPIKDNKHLLRDVTTNAITNNSYSDYENFLRARKIKVKEHCKLETIEAEIACLKNDLCEIKNLLLKFQK